MVLLELPVPFAAVKFWSGLVRQNADSRRVPKWVKSLLVAVFPYYCDEATSGNASIFATQQDYHRVISELMEPELEKLKNAYPEHQFSLFVDDSPFHEVLIAQEAGLGKRGRNNLLQHEIFGSFIFIATIATSLEADTLGAVSHRPTGCIDCGNCAKVCPGKAIGDSFESFDRTLCASYISQQKGELSPEKAKILKDSKSIYGCDICQLVCPANRDLPRGLPCFCDDVNPTYTSLSLTRQLKGRTPQWRGEAVIRRNINIVERPEKT